MLFRRFITLTVLIAFTAIVFINIVQATTTPERGFSVSDRLKQWELLEQKTTCPRKGELCRTGLSSLNKV